MRTVVVGDVHGCAAELDALLQAAGPDRVVLVGDLFTRGPDPVGVWRIVQGHDAVLGNHDDKLLRELRAPKGGAVGRVVRALDRADRAWRAWVRALPLFLDVGRYCVVHAGLHPSGDRERTTREMALTMRRWPDDSPGNRFWWELYEGEQAVLYGHDAARGHRRIEHGGAPFLVGLDSGCVYGGRLTGWLVEEERVVQVPARSNYAEMGPLGP